MFGWALHKGIDTFEREWNYDTSYRRDMIDASPHAAWLVSRLTHLPAVAALVGGFGLAAPAAAHVSGQPAAVSVYTLSPGRIAASVAAVVGLIGAVIGGRALVRSAGGIGTGNGRRGAIVALVHRAPIPVHPRRISKDHPDTIVLATTNTTASSSWCRGGTPFPRSCGCATEGGRGHLA